MNMMEFQPNAFESRLNVIENFLEIRDSAECNNGLSNRITEGLNATADALNNNIALTEKALEGRLSRLQDHLRSLSGRVLALEERLAGLEKENRA